MSLPLLRDAQVVQSMAGSGTTPQESTILVDLRAVRDLIAAFDWVAVELNATTCSLLLLLDQKLTAQEETAMKHLVAALSSSQWVVVVVPPQRTDEPMVKLPFQAALAAVQDELMPPISLIMCCPDTQSDASSQVAPPPGRAIMHQISAVVQEIMGHSVEASQPLMDAGLTSSDAVTLVATLEEAMGLTLPGTLAFDHPSLDAIAKYVTSLTVEPDPQAEGAIDLEADSYAAHHSGTIGIMGRAEIERLLGDAVADILGHGVGHSQPLMEAGMTSSNAVALVSQLEDVFGASFPGTLAFDYPSLGAISEFILAEVGSKGPLAVPPATAKTAVAPGVPHERAATAGMLCRALEADDRAAGFLLMGLMRALVLTGSCVYPWPKLIQKLGSAGVYSYDYRFPGGYELSDTLKDCVDVVPLERWDSGNLKGLSPEIVSCLGCVPAPSCVKFSLQYRAYGPLWVLDHWTNHHLWTLIAIADSRVKYTHRLGLFVKSTAMFDPPLLGLLQSEAECMDPQQRLLLLCAVTTLKVCISVQSHVFVRQRSRFLKSAVSPYS
jgi:acyl carrier protein